mmetsp:Transcript_43859/g.74871  ORF Transcript_43859/g.74871 Transcript_43859/m.74871 type:complete len:101 (+) Transcript_43859:466-768(+)
MAVSNYRYYRQDPTQEPFLHRKQYHGSYPIVTVKELPLGAKAAARVLGGEVVLYPRSAVAVSGECSMVTVSTGMAMFFPHSGKQHRERFNNHPADEDNSD